MPTGVYIGSALIWVSRPQSNPSAWVVGVKLYEYNLDISATELTES